METTGCDGNANVRAEFQLDPPAGKPAVHADIELDHALVTLPALDVQVNDTGARLSIDDTAAILHTAREMAGGDVEASGQVDLGMLYRSNRRSM